MVEEEKEELQGEEIKPKKKKGKGLILIIVIAVAVLLGGGGAFFFLSKSGGDKAHKKGDAAASAKDEASVMFALDPFVVNLSDQGANKFLKVSMQLELANQTLMESAKAKTPQIRDAIINLLTSKTSDTLMSPEGKLQLKDEINMMANQVLGENTVKNVYLTEFVMQ